MPDNNDMEKMGDPELGARIKKRRKSMPGTHGPTMSLRDLGAKVGRSHAVIRKWEEGFNKAITYDDFLALANALNTNVYWLRTGLGDPDARGPVSDEEVDWLEIFRALPEDERTELRDIARIKMRRLDRDDEDNQSE